MILSTKFSAMLSVIWDWSDNSTTNKTTTPQEAYRLSPTRLNSVGGDEDLYPHEVVETRLRMRGRGTTAVLRFESTTGKDFVLIGHSMAGSQQTDSKGNK